MTDDMVLVPGGALIMGASEEQVRRLVESYGVNPDLFATQTPQDLDVESFLIDRFPVTNRDYPRVR